MTGRTFVDSRAERAGADPHLPSPLRGRLDQCRPSREKIIQEHEATPGRVAGRQHMTTAQDDAPALTEQDSAGADAATPPAAAGIAETVGRVLAMAAAAASPSRPGDAAEIEAINDAMIRLLVGTPLRSGGQFDHQVTRP